MLINIVKYNKDPVYEFVTPDGIIVVRRKDDSYMNALQILKVGKVPPRVITGLNKELLKEYKSLIKYNVGDAKYRGIYVSLADAKKLAKQYEVSDILEPAFELRDEDIKDAQRRLVILEKERAERHEKKVRTKSRAAMDRATANKVRRERASEKRKLEKAAGRSGSGSSSVPSSGGAGSSGRSNRADSVDTQVAGTLKRSRHETDGVKRVTRHSAVSIRHEQLDHLSRPLIIPEGQESLLNAGFAGVTAPPPKNRITVDTTSGTPSERISKLESIIKNLQKSEHSLKLEISKSGKLLTKRENEIQKLQSKISDEESSSSKPKTIREIKLSRENSSFVSLKDDLILIISKIESSQSEKDDIITKLMDKSKKLEDEILQLKYLQSSNTTSEQERFEINSLENEIEKEIEKNEKLIENNTQLRKKFENLVPPRTLIGRYKQLIEIRNEHELSRLESEIYDKNSIINELSETCIEFENEVESLKVREVENSRLLKLREEVIDLDKSLIESYKREVEKFIKG